MPNFTLVANGKNMALLWPKQGPNRVPQIGVSLILIDVPRDVPCKISHCWVYPVSPLIEMAKIWPFRAKHGPHKVLQMDSS